LISKSTMQIMKAFKDWVTGSGVALSTVKINKWLPKKYYMIAGKIVMFFSMRGMRKLSIRLSLFHVHLFLQLPAPKAN
jgi:hypothetical protein